MWHIRGLHHTSAQRWSSTHFSLILSRTEYPLVNTARQHAIVCTLAIDSSVGVQASMGAVLAATMTVTTPFGSAAPFDTGTGMAPTGELSCTLVVVETTTHSIIPLQPMRWLHRLQAATACLT